VHHAEGAIVIERMVSARRRVLERRARRVPSFRVGDGGSEPSVYYVAPDRDRPSGGVRVIYRHVGLLNQLGVRAFVMHQRPGFSCTWFEHDTPVLAGRDAELGPADVLVVPEWYGTSLHRVPSVPRLVVFNQGAYRTFDCVDYDRTGPRAPYSGLERLVAFLAVSEDNVDYLRYTFPDIPVALTRNVIDPEVFRPDPTRLPSRRIAVVPTRRPAELSQLRHILRARGIMNRWSIVPIMGRSERETAAVMQDAALFLSLGEREGFGLPPAEAMASGCYVVGFTGLAGREYFDPAYSAPVPDGDVIALARAVEKACELFERDPGALVQLGRKASEATSSRYSLDGLRADLEAFYGSLL
jgi:hypothetical protein